MAWPSWTWMYSVRAVRVPRRREVVSAVELRLGKGKGRGREGGGETDL